MHTFTYSSTSSNRTKREEHFANDLRDGRNHTLLVRWYGVSWPWFEVYLDDELVGGLYGVRVGGLFAGESMFHRATDASKVAMVHTVEWLNDTRGRLFDVQWTTPHLETLGAVDMDRATYLKRFARAIESPSPTWSMPSMIGMAA